MKSPTYDIIVIGAGSAGLGVSLFMAKVGLKTLLIDKSDEHIGGDCLNYGCVPSKALIHVSRLMHQARSAGQFGYTVTGKPDIGKAMDYVFSRQNIIRKHENAEYLRGEGLDVVLGLASFHSHTSITVGDIVYNAKKIVLATGSRPSPLNVPGIEKVIQYNNESIFNVRDLPGRMLVVGGGPIGIEFCQALNRLGIRVTVVHRGPEILPHDDSEVSAILFERLKAEGIEFIVSAEVKEFTSATQATIASKDGTTSVVEFDAVLVAAGRSFELESLNLNKAGIQVNDGRIKVNKYLQTSNRRVYTVGDIAGSLQFSHAAEQHARLLLNNLFSPLKKKLDNSHMSWVTFTDPEVATFGLSERQLRESNKPFEKLVMSFADDDRAVTDDYRYGKLVLYVSRGSLLVKQKILGGSMIAPGAGELIQELILANAQGIPIDAIFNKIYPYPVASRVNQMIIVKHKEKILTGGLNKLLRFAYRLLN